MVGWLNPAVLRLGGDYLDEQEGCGAKPKGGTVWTDSMDFNDKLIGCGYYTNDYAAEPEPLKNSVPMQNGKEVQMAYPWMAENRFNI